MAQETTDLVLEHLRHIRSVVDDTRQDVKRLMLLRAGVTEQYLATLQVPEAGQNLEIDRLKERLDRLERRLELTE